MNTDDSLLAEIRDANLSYLILAQRLIRDDRAQALFRLGISEEVALVLDALTASQMIRIASRSGLMFRLRFDEEMIWDLLADHGRNVGEVENASASSLHASILMAGKFSEVL